MTTIEVRGDTDRRSLVKRFERKSKQQAISELIDHLMLGWGREDHLEAGVERLRAEVEQLRQANAQLMDPIVRAKMMAPAPPIILPNTIDHSHLEVPRELLERATRDYTGRPNWDALEPARLAAVEELRALLKNTKKEN